MESLRDVIMECLEEFFAEDEEVCTCDERSDGRCPELADSDAAMCAVIKHLRERIDSLEERVAALERRPQLVAEPISTNSNNLMPPDQVRYKIAYL